jgi:hypothetical protein
VPAAIRPSFLRRTHSGEENPRSLVPDFMRYSPVRSATCELCEEAYSRESMACVGPCEHLFCGHCLAAYAIYRIDAMKDVVCPREGCA